MKEEIAFIIVIVVKVINTELKYVNKRESSVKRIFVLIYFGGKITFCFRDSSHVLIGFGTPCEGARCAQVALKSTSFENMASTSINTAQKKTDRFYVQ